MIGIIDYDAGNIQSVINALDDYDIDYILSYKTEELEKCSKIILPGVGEANYAMNKLKEKNLIEFIKNYKNPFIGICLGMQLLCEYSEERETECLGIIPTSVVKFHSENVIVPQMGWNDVKQLSEDKLFANIPDETSFYFANSYYVPKNQYTVASCDYEKEISAIVKKDNFYGMQFHPEKSGKFGIKILENFIKLC